MRKTLQIATSKLFENNQNERYHKQMFLQK